jgi:protein-S-isoprenylcysteine O-methyltransferase Ste14
MPWLILTSGGETPEPEVWPALVLIVAGAALYLWCLWLFATVGRGTPGPWDAPRRFVAVGPFRWVRNPIYVGVVALVAGEALLFLSRPLLVYGVAAAVVFHLLVIGYEEPTLARRFGETYAVYRRMVRCWIPRRPRDGVGSSARKEERWRSSTSWPTATCRDVTSPIASDRP